MRKLLVPSFFLLLSACHHPNTISAGSRIEPLPNAPVVAAGTLDVAALATRVNPSVVNITAARADKVASMFGGDRVVERKALGSGFIVDPSGRVVTNAHVVEGADVVRVRLDDGRDLDADVIGRDPKLDLAVLQIRGVKDLPAVTLGSSAKLKVGEYVVAIGNPFGLDHTVTLGILSAKGRTIGAGPYDDFLQTDASINPGNSGGPLFDTRGAVVGINTAISAEGKGIGFAIPVDVLAEVLPELVEKGRVVRGKLGVEIQEIDATLAKALGLEGPNGALVDGVEPNGPAEKAGLHTGDVIVAVDGTTIGRSTQLPREIARHEPGSTVKLAIVRKGAKQTLAATLAELAEPHAEKPKDKAEEAAPKGRLGVAAEDAEGGGAAIVSVAPKSAASAAELRPGDVIVSIDGKSVENASDLRKRIGALPKGKAVALVVHRGDHARFVGVEI
ncbi:MAG: trypsin-like peptidase domain-containing protein [Polyangiales bacterium]